MCGIAGLVEPSLSMDSGRVRIRDVERMLDAIAHRGPDESRVSRLGDAVLGTARLAQVDRPTSRQPMGEHSGRYLLVFNGEVYNFPELRRRLEADGTVFATSGDTEVVLQHLIRWGVRGLRDLNGQFALALWDSVHSELLLARDRFGITPLYWAQHAGRISFGSEVRALHAGGMPTQLSVRDVVDAGVLWGVHPGRSAFAGVRSIAPGGYVRYARGRSTEGSYWRFEFDEERDAAPMEDQARQLNDLLRAAVTRRIPVYGDPAVLLSGGLDSTAVLSLVRGATGPSTNIDSFSIQFTQSSLDESGFQRVASESYGTNHLAITCDEVTVAETLREAVLHAELPLVRTAPASSIGLAATIEAGGTRAVLSGEGADELFCGYDIFKVAAIRDAWAADPTSSHWSGQLELAVAQQRSIGRTVGRTFYERGLERRDDPIFSHLNRWSASFGITRYLSPEIRADLSLEGVLDGVRDRLPDAYRAWSAVEQAQYLEVRYFLASALLGSQCDRPYMAHSIEARYPFLDNDVADFAMRLPQSSKLDGTMEKAVLKAACRDVPQAIRERTKQPYTAPEGDVFRSSPGRSLLATFLGPSALARTGLFDAARVDWLIRKLERRATSFHDDLALLWVLSTQILADTYGVAEPLGEHS